MYRITERTKTIVFKDKNSHLSINLVLVGFAQQGIITADFVIDSLRLLPAAHLSGLKEISFNPDDSAIYPYPVRDRNRIGEFAQDSRQIMIYKIDSHGQFQHTLFHEIGHHVYHTKVPPMLKKEWATQLFPKSQFVTQYASINPSEDFAECYAFYAKREQNLSKLVAKYRFMKYKVFTQ